MNTKSLAILAILAAVGVGLYIKINSVPLPEPPEEAAGTYDGAPQISLGDESSGFGLPGIATGEPTGGAAPPFTPDSEAPAFGGTSDSVAPPFQQDGVSSTGTDSNLGTAPPFGASGENDLAPSPPAGGDFTTPDSPGDIPDYRDLNSAPAADEKSAAPAATHLDSNIASLSSHQTTGGDQHRAEFQRTWNEAQTLLKNEQLDAALKLLSSWYGEPALSADDHQRLNALLSQLAGTVIYSRDVHIEPAYKVEQYESLSDIAARCQVSEQLLININGLASPDLRAGQRLKLLPGPFMAVVDKERGELVLFLDGRYAGKFPIGIGANFPELGEDDVQLVVTKKLQNPTYYGETTIEGGHPDNPLGTIWVELGAENDDGPGSLAIHGTNDPANFARPGGAGFVRLNPRDAIDAYTILSVGSPVIVRP